MAWNEPGGNNNDPWGNRNNSGGPPDLDEVFKNLKKKIDGLLGGNSDRGRNGNPFGEDQDEPSGGQGPSGNPWGQGGNRGGGFPGSLSPKLIGIGALLLALLWLFSGIYILQPAEQGVITQFGKYKKTVGSGLHWRVPWPVQNIEILDVEQRRAFQLTDQLILTQDENIVDIDMAVQFKIKSAEDHLFNVRDPVTTLQEVVESAVREVIGQTNMQPVITTGRQTVDSATLASVQEILDSYGSGIDITAVELNRAQPPEEVQAAFSDVIKAREDKERFINEAEAYRNEVLPKARGEAQQIIEESLAYKAQVENAAEGESRRFSALLEEFEKAPEITRDRLYLEAMESVLSNSSKVLMDAEGGNNLMYLPLDKLMNQSGGENRTMPGTSSLPNTAPSPGTQLPRRLPETNSRQNLRSRSRESR